MDERSHGIILRTRPLTETSLIIHWLTPGAGRLATVARGARRPKSPFRGKLDLFYEADFSFARSRRSELHGLREVILGDTRPALREDLGKLRQAAYAAALIEQVTETDAPLGGVFALTKAFLDTLARRPAGRLKVLAFELKLLGELGQAPDLAAAPLNPGTRKAAGHLREVSWDDLDHLKLSVLQSRELEQFLSGFMVYHLDRLPKGRNAALAP